MLSSRFGAAAVAALLTLACRASDPEAQTSAPAAVQSATVSQLAAVRSAALPVTGSGSDYDPLIRAAQGATRILLGESTHGTHEFYRERARITHRLIREAGINAVAIEGDWTPTQRVNLYVRGLGRDRTAEQALRGYTRFPEWMWRNTDFRDFVEQLRTHNLAVPANQRVGIYGMDVYDLYEAADVVVERLSALNPAAARRARGHYRCFAGHGGNTQTYGQAAQRASASCRDGAAAVLAEVRRLPRPAAAEAAEVHFDMVRAAASVAAAEEYFRTVYTGASAWNVRDQSMSETVEDIAAHVARLSGREGKVVMWSHNTHSGDARATSAARRGELNLGQLMKQRHGPRAHLVGFFTYSGTVYAAPGWGQPGRMYQLRPALPGSSSALFHQTGLAAFTLLLEGNPQLERQLSSPMMQRAVGVIYAPHQERSAHYFHAVLAEQFDAAIYFDHSQAVRPL